MCLTFFIIKIKERLKKIVSPLYIQRKKNIAPKTLLTFIHSVSITRVWSRGWNASKQQNRQFSKSLYSIEGIKRNTISRVYSTSDDDTCYEEKESSKENMSCVYRRGGVMSRGRPVI